jgi:hypothetical protein
MRGDVVSMGKIVHEWTDIDSGEAVSSIVRNLPCPPLALDPIRPRFAVATPSACCISSDGSI